MPKPRNSGPQDFQDLAEDLPERIRTLSRIQVLPNKTAPLPQPLPTPDSTITFVIAASTGGPQAINTVLRKLPADFPSPILVVQHISHGFLQGLVHWLERECKLKVQIASHGEAVRPGHIYFAPTQRHMELRSGSLFLTDAAPLNGCKPSADVLFSSAARAGGRVIAIVLTGMGADGLEGSRALNRSHHAVLAQSPRSCAVAGMPSAVIEAGQATQVLDLEGIAEEMCRLAQV